MRVYRIGLEIWPGLDQLIILANHLKIYSLFGLLVHARFSGGCMVPALFDYIWMALCSNQGAMGRCDPDSYITRNF
jgi:hypothetical protein